MIRRISNAIIVDRGIFKRRYTYSSGKYEYRFSWTYQEFNKLINKQLDSPISLIHKISDKKRIWIYKDEFYSADDDLTSKEIQALIEKKNLKRRREIEKAVSLLDANIDIEEKRKRRNLDPAVMQAVYERDGGKCVFCGSKEDLEFDHILPFSKGGNNAAKNLRLLCEHCNRSRGGEF